MKEFWINVYCDYRLGNSRHSSRVRAIFTSADMALTYGMKTVYRLHVRLK